MTKIRMTRMVVLMSSMWTALALALQMESDFLTVLWSHFPKQHTTTPCGTFFNCSTRKWQCGSRILPNFRCYFAEQLAAPNINGWQLRNIHSLCPVRWRPCAFPHNQKLLDPVFDEHFFVRPKCSRVKFKSGIQRFLTSYLAEGTADSTSHIWIISFQL